MSGDEISDKGRQERFAQWEKIGLDRIKHDLQNGGHRVVGGPLQEQELAWEWVRLKEDKAGRVYWSRLAEIGRASMRRGADGGRVGKVFVVHGHDDGAREAVARFIEKLGFEAVILHEQPNKGRTIITKFREEAADVGFAVVLMTPDDVGAVAPSDPLKPRARQNVVFELGFFIGALGPERVAALVKGDVERPSDFDGVVYISLDRGNWKTDLSKELAAAGYDIDWKKAAGA